MHDATHRQRDYIPDRAEAPSVLYEELAMELGNLARELQQQSPDELLAAIVRSAIDLIPGVEGGSISVVTGRKEITAEGETGETSARIDAIQMEEGQGPCLDAVYEQEVVTVPDIRADPRWPDFARRVVAETDARGMLAFQLFVEDDNLGALNLYSTRINAFTEESREVGLLVAAHAAVAFAASREVAQLQEAIARRDVIGQAKGILMERYKVTEDRAFLLLAKISNHRNTKLYEVASQLVRTGTVTGASPNP